jgi:predicted RNase H-like HicB family nuclease
MATRDFKVFLEPDADYRGYAVVCRSIPGCYSQGRSQRLCQKIREAIEVSLEGMDSRDEQLPDPSEVLIGSVLVTRGATLPRTLGRATNPHRRNSGTFPFV